MAAKQAALTAAKLFEEKTLSDDLPTIELKDFSSISCEELVIDISKKEVDDAIKYLQNIDNKYAKSINDKINNDEIKYSYTQPKQEVKYLGKIKAELNLENNNGLKIS